MKKFFVGLMMFMLLFSLSVFASKFAEYDEVVLIDASDNSEGQYKTVNIRIDGKDILSDVPAIIYPGDRTLVPISFITSSIGAGIEWNNDTKEATIDHKGKKILLKINSKTAYVDDKPYTLPSNVAAKLMTFEGKSRTMVPVRFVSEQLGYEIFWDNSTRTVSLNKPKQEITGVRYDTSGVYPELRFKVSGEIGLTSFSVDGASVGGKDALILDFHNAELKLSKSLTNNRFYIYDAFEGVLDIKLDEKEGNPPSVQGVVNLEYYRHGEVSYDKNRGEMVVQLINSVKYVDLETVNQVTAVVIETNEEPAINKGYNAKENKVIIDIIHSKLSEEDSLIQVNEGGIKFVESLQDNSTLSNDYDASGYGSGTRFSRVIVALEDYMSDDNVYVDNIGSKVYVYVQEKMFGTYAYSRNLEKGTSSFALSLNTPNIYPVSFNEQTNTVFLSVPKEDTKLTEGRENKDDGVISSINVIDNASAGTYDIEIKLIEGTTYEASTLNASNFEIAFASEVLQQSEFKDKLVVIDAGHGGHDPGASYGGLYEKDVNLATSLAVRKKLENLGFKVYMTRERDNYVQLYDRAAIANQLKADLFVSVHANAAGSTKARGIETLYAPDNSRNNLAFAKVIQDHMIKATGNYNRGVVSRPELVVIRETDMDAVLVEIGFLTNTSDHEKLSTDLYINAVADGIVNGIVKYME